jgi:hypothetical protein
MRRLLPALSNKGRVLKVDRSPRIFSPVGVEGPAAANGS